MTKEKIDITKYTKYFKAIFFITAVINILLFAQKKETILEKADYKILVQESEGSSNYVEYNGSTFPKNGYVLSSYECANGGVITQNEAKAITFTGGTDTCTLKFDLSGQMHSENSLYYVLMNEANNGGLATKYTGEHADAYDRSGTEDIYYFTTPTENDETQANELLDKWNVIFGGFCWQMLRTTDTGGVKMIYNGVPSNGTCNNTGTDQQIGTSAFNTNNNSPAYAGYMYNTVYELLSKNAYATIMYGNNFTYSNGTYNLTDTEMINNYPTAEELQNHHYTCFNTSGTCTSISYIYKYSTDDRIAHYISLTNGKNVEDAIDEMLYADDVNTTNSTIKTYIDNWYQSNLSSYTDDLEDTVFCNDRRISDLGGWNPNGGSVGKYINFYSTTGDLSCINNTDRFSTLNNSAKLTYPIGLASDSEMTLINNNLARKTGALYWLGTPDSFDNNDGVNERIVYYVSGRITALSGNSVLGVRPVISLKPDTEYSSGDGSKNNPYVVSTSN